MRRVARRKAVVPNPSPYVPAGLVEAFSDDFDGPLSIESGSLPTTGEVWADSFVQFSGQRSLPANNDECLKGRPGYSNSGGPTFESLGMHTMQQAGSSLILGAYEIPVANRPQFFGFPYAGPHLDSRRSCNFDYGYVEFRFRAVSLGAGIHWSLWLWSSASNDYEIDAVEIIGSNSFSPNGPINILFLNSHDNRGGANHSATFPQTFINTPQIDMHDWHVYGVEITPTDINWAIDGVQQRTISNIYPAGTPWQIYLSMEMGESPSGDFPGPVNATTPLPNFAELDYIRVYTSDGTLIPEPPIPEPIDTTPQVDEVLSSEFFATGLGDWSTPGANDPASGSWTHLTTATPTGSTGPAGGAAPTTLIATDGFGYAYTEASGAGSPASFSLESIPIDASLGTSTLTFAYHMRFGTGVQLTDGTLRVQGWDGAAWSNIGDPITGSQQGSAADPYLRSSALPTTYDSSGFNNADFRFRFLFERGASVPQNFDYDAAVDTVQIIGPTGAASGGPGTGGGTGSGGTGAAVGIIHEFSGADGVDAWTGTLNMTNPEAAHTRANVSAPASRVFAGSQSLQTEIKNGDPKAAVDINSPSAKRRAEFSGRPFRYPGNEAEGWFGAAFYLPSDPMGSIRGCTIFQLHNHDDEGEMLQVSCFAGSMQFVTDGPSTNQVLGSLSLANAQGGLLDRWVRMVCQFKPATNATGFMRIWLNDVQVLDFSGQTKPSGVQGPYFKFGTYFWGYGNDPAKRALCLYDNIRLGGATSNFDSVNPANFVRTD